MDINSILTILVSVIPAASSVATAIGIMFKTLKNFNELKKEVSNATELKQFKEQLNLILEENLKLKKEIEVLIEYSKTINKISGSGE